MRLLKIDWRNWSLERVWHAMRGSYPWLDPIGCPAALRGGRYRVGEYEAGEPRGEPGHVCRDGGGWYVAHSAGRIRICRARAPGDEQVPREIQG